MRAWPGQMWVVVAGVGAAGAAVASAKRHRADREGDDVGAVEESAGTGAAGEARQSLVGAFADSAVPEGHSL